MFNRNYFELPVKLITRLRLPGFVIQIFGGRECRFRQAACLTIAQRFSALALNRRLLREQPISVCNRVKSRCGASGCRSNISVSASFVWRCLSGSALAPFPHPAHRTGHADFPHPACMGLSLSSEHRAIFVVLCHSILLFDPRREHSSGPTAYFHRRRAQRRSRTALLQRRRRPVLDGREHGGRLPAIGWLAAR